METGSLGNWRVLRSVEFKSAIKCTFSNKKIKNIRGVTVETDQDPLRLSSRPPPQKKKKQM